VNSSRSLGSTHRGLIEWLVQRVSSVYLAGFVVYLLILFALCPFDSYAAWSSHFAKGAVRLAWGLFFVSLLLHTWTGLRSIYLDYLHAVWLRLTVTAMTAVVLIGLGLWSAAILLRGIV
jgi:succinate dehydrogenase / fumarate reductase membrane anchor subunit